MHRLFVTATTQNGIKSRFSLSLIQCTVCWFVKFDHFGFYPHRMPLSFSLSLSSILSGVKTNFCCCCIFKNMSLLATCANNENTALHLCMHSRAEYVIAFCSIQYTAAHRLTQCLNITIMIQTIIRADCDWNIEQLCRIRIVSFTTICVCCRSFI